MTIPRNLVYVFLCVIVGAFLGMIYILYTDASVDVFGKAELNSLGVTVHPLFKNLRSHLTEYMFVPEETIQTITTQRFYNEYLTKSIPLLIKDGCEYWSAY